MNAKLEQPGAVANECQTGAGAVANECQTGAALDKAGAVANECQWLDERQLIRS